MTGALRGGRAVALVAAVALLAGCSSSRAEPTGPAASAPAPVLRPAVVRTIPHDTGAFTEGLAWQRGRLFESTGLYGVSDVREVDPGTGRVLRRRRLAGRYFGEGLAVTGGRLVQLTYREATGFVWSRDRFAPLRRFTYPGEGWGLATMGSRLVMSDGTSALRVLDGRTFAETGPRVAVTDAGRPPGQLNELEVVHGLVWANLFPTDRVAVIDPATGDVRAILDLAFLRSRLPPGGRPEVLNGIAWDRARDRVLVTGKWWPTMFALRIPAELR